MTIPILERQSPVHPWTPHDQPQRQAGHVARSRLARPGIHRAGAPGAQAPGGPGWRRIQAEYTAVLMQGSGTFAIESVIGSVIPPAGRLVVLVNGAYGERMVKIARRLGIDTHSICTPENCTGGRRSARGLACRRRAGDPCRGRALRDHHRHHRIRSIGSAKPLARFGCSLIVDAMSSFGAYPVDLAWLGHRLPGLFVQQVHRRCAWLCLCAGPHRGAPGNPGPCAQREPGSVGAI